MESLNHSTAWELWNQIEVIMKRARKYYEESLSLSCEIGDKRVIAESLTHHGILACDQLEYKQAVILVSASEIQSGYLGFCRMNTIKKNRRNNHNPS